MKFLRIGQVMQLTGLSRMTIYRLELAGEFPKRRQLSRNSVAWLDTDIDRWAESRPAGLRREISETAHDERPASSAARKSGRGSVSRTAD